VALLYGCARRCRTWRRYSLGAYFPRLDPFACRAGHEAMLTPGWSPFCPAGSRVGSPSSDDDNGIDPAWYNPIGETQQTDDGWERQGQVIEVRAPKQSLSSLFSNGMRDFGLTAQYTISLTIMSAMPPSLVGSYDKRASVAETWTPGHRSARSCTGT